MKKYKAAVIGIGRIGMLLESDPKRTKPATHVGLWIQHPRTELVAVCDNDPKKFEVAKSMKPDVRTYTDPEELLKTEKPDIVTISTWKDTHYEMMKLALKYNIPAIVLEKPIAEKVEHAREIVDEANEKGINLFINHRRRFDSLLYEIRDGIRQGLIGEVLQVTSHYVFGLVTTGTHLIDALRFFLGDIKWVAAFPNKKEHFAPPDDPCVDGFIGFENDVKVALQSLNMKDYDIFNTDFYGRKGKLSFKNIGRDFELYKVIESPEHQGFTELENHPSQRWGGQPRNQFMFLGDNVVDCLEGKAKSLSTGEDSLKALEALLAMQESVKQDGKKIYL
ncbi:MAG: Gfo/Idh/MocA family oxidoreductase [bacterium]|nr:Gfo/Idh/MocA family oxidoreductase [bacterium]